MKRLAMHAKPSQTQMGMEYTVEQKCRVYTADAHKKDIKRAGAAVDKVQACDNLLEHYGVVTYGACVGA